MVVYDLNCIQSTVRSKARLSEFELVNVGIVPFRTCCFWLTHRSCRLPSPSDFLFFVLNIFKMSSPALYPKEKGEVILWDLKKFSSGFIRRRVHLRGL